MVKIEIKKPYRYSIYIKIRQPYLIEKIGSILYNYLTHNEHAIYTKSSMFENDKNNNGIEIKVYDYNPSKSLKENETNAVKLATLLLQAFYEERAIIQFKSKTLWVYNDRI